MLLPTTYNNTTNLSLRRSNSAFSAPFPHPNFTGKETDCETGFSYFGARYYDPTLLTSWTAVDPMADKYPNISPYAYCAWNPIKIVDPDGCDTFSVDREGHFERIGKSGADVLCGIDKYGNKTYSAAMPQGTISNNYGEGEIPINGQESITGFECELNGTSEDRMTAFKFLSQNTDVEWSLFSVGNKNGDIQYWLTNSHDKGERRGNQNQKFDNYGTTLILIKGNEGYKLIARIHNHKDDPNPSNHDKKYAKNMDTSTHYIFCSRTQSFSKIELNKWDGFIMVGENEIKGL